MGKIFGIGGKNALSLHPLSEGGAPAGRDGEEGRAGKEGEGREAERERERGISLSFSSSEKSLKKYAERFGGERKKTLSLHPLSPEKNRLMMNDE